MTGLGGLRTSETSFPVRDSQHTVPLLHDSVLCKMLDGFVHRELIDCGKQNPGHFLGDWGSEGRSEDSTFLVMQHRPLAGHCAFRSISSHSRAKNPVTHVPEHDPGGNLLTSALGVGVDLGVELVVVTSVRDGITNSGGKLPDSKICLETQHFIFCAQMESTSRMASQKPASLSATHTPGHFSMEELNRRIVVVFIRYFIVIKMIIIKR